jgi:signal transduction histidine kinase
MRAQMGTRLGRMVVLPFATIGVLAALLVWEVEHVGSITLALVLAGIAVFVGVLVARRVRGQIDELSEYYEALLRKAEEESQRAEAAGRIRDEFLATLSHELRTPLNSVLGWARLLAGKKLDEAKTAKAIQAIERAGWAQSRLIEDLLDVSRIVGGRLQILTRPTVVQPIIGFVIQALEPAAEAKNITVETHLDPAIGPISVDPDRMQQITWHLVSNAIKFTSADGRVSVALSRRDHHAPVRRDRSRARHRPPSRRAARRDGERAERGAEPRCHVRSGVATADPDGDGASVASARGAATAAPGSQSAGGGR